MSAKRKSIKKKDKKKVNLKLKGLTKQLLEE